MLLLLMEHYREFLRKLHFYAWEEVSFRAMLAILTSLLVALIWGPKIIRWLIRMKVGDVPEFDHKDLNELTSHKANTPTMGGLIILLGIFVSTLLWADLRNPFIQKGMFLLVWLGLLGGWDDYLKQTAIIKHRSRSGVHTWEKLIFQLGLGVLLAWSLHQDFRMIPDGQRLWLPFYKYGLPLGYAGFMIMTTLVITGTSNAVNLTDGMDGLATGCVAIVSLAFVILCYLASENMSPLVMETFQNELVQVKPKTWADYLLLPQIGGAGELAILCAAICGACFGFLWFNCHPAQVFMGDVGSLPLGGAIGFAAVATRQELLLLLVGGVFVLEAVSVILQVSYYRFSGGKRIFRCAPIHHHYHLTGWSEPQVVVRFWLMGVACAALALATLKLR